MESYKETVNNRREVKIEEEEEEEGNEIESSNVRMRKIERNR